MEFLNYILCILWHCCLVLFGNCFAGWLGGSLGRSWCCEENGRGERRRGVGEETMVEGLSGLKELIIETVRIRKLTEVGGKCLEIKMILRSLSHGNLWKILFVSSHHLAAVLRVMKTTSTSGTVAIKQSFTPLIKVSISKFFPTPSGKQTSNS